MLIHSSMCFAQNHAFSRNEPVMPITSDSISRPTVITAKTVCWDRPCRKTLANPMPTTPHRPGSQKFGFDGFVFENFPALIHETEIAANAAAHISSRPIIAMSLRTLDPACNTVHRYAPKFITTAM